MLEGFSHPGCFDKGLGAEEVAAGALSKATDPKNETPERERERGGDQQCEEKGIGKKEDVKAGGM